MTPPDNDARAAEQARRERDGDPVSGTLRVKALATVAVGDKVHEEGSTFTAPVAAVEQALARGLVEQVAKSKGGS